MKREYFAASEMASGSIEEDMAAETYTMDDDEMDLMIRSMNTGGTTDEYVEQGTSEEFDWGRMNDALGPNEAMLTHPMNQEEGPSYMDNCPSYGGPMNADNDMCSMTNNLTNMTIE